MAPRKPRTDLFQGTLDLIVLQMLQAQPSNGWELTQRIAVASNDVLRVNDGSLYPALYRLAARGWIASEWRVSENNRRAKVYSVTAAGRRRLSAERDTWQRFAGALAAILKTT
jgi:PadR family transcriptional regulator, regulatory protein PadR